MNRPRPVVPDDLRLPRLTLMGCGVWWVFFRIGGALGAGQNPLAAIQAGRLPAAALLSGLLLTRVHPVIGGWCLTLSGAAIITASPFLEFRLASVIPSEAIVLALSFPLIFLGLFFNRAVRDARAETGRRVTRPPQVIEEFRFAGRS
ncbi:MAG: hypothetical protein Q8P50_15875 [Bacillota bacterium]|nr:hypothetical protein [Bacillota bacterium]